MQNVFHRNRFRCMSRKIIRSTPNRNNLFGRKMKSSLNYLFIRLTDVIVRNKHRELQLLLKLENGDVRCNQYISWLLEIYQSSFLKKYFVLYFTKMLLTVFDFVQPHLNGRAIDVYEDNKGQRHWLKIPGVLTAANTRIRAFIFCGCFLGWGSL